MPGSHPRSSEHHTSKRTLTLALAITGSLFVIEFAAGFLTNSLALIADAGHMLTDVAALALSLFALKISARHVRQHMARVSAQGQAVGQKSSEIGRAHV